VRIIFFGSSDFSIPPFEYCLSSGYSVTAVVTTPDQPKGRGLRVQANPLKKRSEEKKVPTFAFSSLRNESARDRIAHLEPDLFVVASYGKLIPASWLRLPKRAALNIHPSLLPKFRGAAPIAWQILEGEKETGVSIAEVTPELDAGDLFYQIRIPLGPRDTTRSLTDRLSVLSAKGLAEVLSRIEGGGLKRTPQTGESSYAKKLVKEDGCLSFSDSAETSDRKIRAFNPWPGTFVTFQGKPLRIYEAIPEGFDLPESKAGTLLSITPEGGMRIQTAWGKLVILKVQLPGRQMISGEAFANGQRLKPGFIFSPLSS